MATAYSFSFNTRLGHSTVSGDVSQVNIMIRVASKQAYYKRDLLGISRTLNQTGDKAYSVIVP